tara:strand:- start:885 stop:2045 length:1161 start_codon:yes stop_codon:yes gene_type:complete
MHINSIKKLKFNLEKLNKANQSNISFSEDRINFLDKLSNKLKTYNNNDDARALALYIKRVLKSDFNLNYPSPCYGIGIVSHYGPGNLPINSIYSWISGFISGNINIVRTSTNANKAQHEIISSISDLCYEYNYKDIFCTEIDPHEFAISTSTYSDARVIWGSDYTIDKIKIVESKSNCRDIIFGHRIAAAIYNLDEITKYSSIKYNYFISSLANDLLFANSEPCTSPSVLFILSKGNRQSDSKNIFKSLIYKAEAVAERKITWDLNSYSKQIKHLQENALSNSPLLFNKSQNQSIRLAFTNKPSFEKRLYRNFEVISTTKLEDIQKDVLSKYHSFTYEGLTNEQINYLSTFKNCHRVIPTGNAHRFELIWDSIDTLRSLIRMPIIR